MDIDMNNLPKHIAIIMDGNRRWAKDRGLSTKEGHKAGSKNLENIASFCNKLGIKYLTVYAFSTENWKRSSEEVATLMLIMKANLDAFSRRVDTENIRIKVLGDLENKVSPALRKSIEKAVEKTKDNTGLTLNIAFNYGGRLELVNAMKNIAKKVKAGELDIDTINEDTISNHLYTAGMPEPDLMIRTSKELRLSNFLPWQLVYTEFYFPDIHWPAFDQNELMKAIEVYQSRNRRFGGRPDEKKQDKAG